MSEIQSILFDLVDENVVVVGLGPVAADAHFHLSLRSARAFRAEAGPVPVSGLRVIILDLVHHSDGRHFFVLVVAFLDQDGSVRDGGAVGIEKNIIHIDLVEGTVW